MKKIDIFEFGWAYEIILFMLAAVFIIDCVGIIGSFRSGEEEIREYAELCVKYLKIIMYFMAGTFFLIVAFSYGYDLTTSLIHGILGGLLIADGAVSLIIKLKYRQKVRKNK